MVGASAGICEGGVLHDADLDAACWRLGVSAVRVFGTQRLISSHANQ